MFPKFKDSVLAFNEGKKAKSFDIKSSYTSERSNLIKNPAYQSPWLLAECPGPLENGHTFQLPSELPPGHSLEAFSSAFTFATRNCLIAYVVRNMCSGLATRGSGWEGWPKGS